MITNYPKEWDELPKGERKKRLRELNKQLETKAATLKKLRNIAITIAVVVALIAGYILTTRKTPEDVAFEKEINEVSLEDKVESFEVAGASHIGPGETVVYTTNPPTSGPHWASPAAWRFNDTELPDEQVVHNLEHGGIWITYKDIDEESVDKLKEIAKNNNDSVVITKRESNEDPIVVASWGVMMKLTEVDEAVIQKYIDTYINQSPERLAR